MAPGIFPPAIPSLRKSSIAESFSTDSTAPGGGPSTTAAADKGAARERDPTMAARLLAGAKWRERARKHLLPDRTIGRTDVIALLQSNPDGRANLVALRAAPAAQQAPAS